MYCLDVLPNVAVLKKGMRSPRGNDRGKGWDRR